MTIITKCQPRPYNNWNATENKTAWELAQSPMPSNWKEILEAKAPSPDD